MNKDVPKKHTVLIVDDEPEILAALGRLMIKEGYEVLSANDGLQAAGILELTIPDIVLTDVAMPGVDGYSLCRQIKEREVSRHVPVLLVTGRLTDEDVQKGLEAGADDYVKKPFDGYELRLRVRNQIRVHQLLRKELNLSAIVRAIDSTARDAIIVMDNDGRIAHWNPSAERIFGYPAAEVVGKNLHQLLAPPSLAPAFEPAVACFQESGQGKRVGLTSELIAYHKNGREFPIELSLSSTILDDRWHAVGVVRDISERKAMETELAHSRKLEAVGQLASGIAHEINTPAQYIGDNLHFISNAVKALHSLINEYKKIVLESTSSGVCEKMIKAIKEAEEKARLKYVTENLPSAVEAALDGVARISKIVGAMKEFAHPAPKEMMPADLNRALENTLVIAKNEYKYVADVETEFGDLPAVTCSVDELNQVFLNLIVNAAHAIGDVVEKTGKRGVIRISSCVAGDCVEIRIADTGGGIPQEVQARVFEPFFTTKEVGKGSGQGLAISRSVVVQKHNGKLSFESQEGVGTTFCVQIPLDRTKS